jgi:hypothetical protein
VESCRGALLQCFRAAQLSAEPIISNKDKPDSLEKSKQPIVEFAFERTIVFLTKWFEINERAQNDRVPG